MNEIRFKRKKLDNHVLKFSADEMRVKMDFRPSSARIAYQSQQSEKNVTRYAVTSINKYHFIFTHMLLSFKKGAISSPHN